MRRILFWASILAVLVIVVACSPTFPLVQDTRAPQPILIPTDTPVATEAPTVAPTEVPPTATEAPTPIPTDTPVVIAQPTDTPVVVEPTATEPTACVIKGNISSKGEKIYHVPGGQFYDATQIDESKGERWFCSTEEAEAAGWRASKR